MICCGYNEVITFTRDPQISMLRNVNTYHIFMCSGTSFWLTMFVLFNEDISSTLLSQIDAAPMCRSKLWYLKVNRSSLTFNDNRTNTISSFQRMRMNRYNDENMSPETVNYTETIRTWTVKRIQYKLPVTAPSLCWRLVWHMARRNHTIVVSFNNRICWTQ